MADKHEVQTAAVYDADRELVFPDRKEIVQAMVTVTFLAALLLAPRVLCHQDIIILQW